MIDQDGREIEYDLLFTVKDEQKNRKFVVYTDLKDPNLDIYAALYDEDKKQIDYIKDKKDQEMIAKILETIKERNKK